MKMVILILLELLKVINEIKNQFFMKRLYLALIFVIITHATYSQSFIRFIDNDNKPIKKIHCLIYKNDNSSFYAGSSNDNGVLELKIINIDYSANYFLNYNNLKHKRVWQKINFKNNDSLTIKLVENEYNIPRTKKQYYSLCSFAEMAYYKPFEIRTYQDLPKEISCKVKRYLKKRVGKKLYHDFQLIGGRIINLENLKNRNKGWKTSKTTYELCFSYRNIDADVNMYTSSIKLDKEGTILKDIEFPLVTKQLKFKKIVSFGEIKNIARRKEIYIEKRIVKKGEYVTYVTEIKMDYDKNNNILIWKFINRTQYSNHTTLNETYSFNAHNSKFIELKSIEGTWIN